MASLIITPATKPISGDFNSSECTFSGHPLLGFSPATEEEMKVLSNAPNKPCELDPGPKSLINACSFQLAPIMTAIVNKSLQASHVPSSYQRAVVRVLLKKPNLDKGVSTII